MRLFALRIAALIGLAAAVAGGSRATASLITVHVTGSLDSNIPAGLAGTFSSGQTWNAIYSFDTTAPNIGTADQAVYNALTAFSFSLGSYSASSNASAELQVDNGPLISDPFVHDRYALVSRVSDGLSGPDVNGYALDGFSFRMDDSTDAVFSSAALPSFLNYNDFDSTGLFISFMPPTGSNDMVYLEGTVKGIRFEEPTVPEPATMSLVALGLIGGVAARRRRTKA